MVVPNRRIAGFLLLGIAALAVVALVPQDADAGTYWAVGLPQPEVQSNSVSTLIAATNVGTAPGDVTLLKAGVAPAGATAPPTVNPNDSGVFTFTEMYQGSVLSNAATYTVETPGTQWEVMQHTNPNPQNSAVVTGADATRLLEQSQLGKVYNIATYADPLNYIGGSPSYFTIISTKDGTTVKVSVTVNTAGSVTCPVDPCATPQRDVPPMTPANSPYVFTVNRGEALHIESLNGELKCRAMVQAVLAQTLLPDCYEARTNHDLTGSTVSCTTACSVFAGAYTVTMQDGFSTKGINSQMNPDASSGQVFVLCAAASAGNGKIDMLRIRSVNAPTLITATSASGLSSAPTGPFSITSALVSNTVWSTFWMADDTVITADDRIHVVQFYASGTNAYENTNAAYVATLGNSFTWALQYMYGGPSMTQVSAMDLSNDKKDFYSPPGWRVWVNVAAKQGTAVSLVDHTAGLTTVLDSTTPSWRDIPGSDYACVSPMITQTTTPTNGGQGGTSFMQTSNGVTVMGQASTGGATVSLNPTGTMLSAGVAHGPAATYSVLNSAQEPMTVQVLGQWQQNGWLRDLGGGQKDTSPPPVTVSFKGVAQVVKCGPTPIQFTVTKAGGVPAYTWFWDFGDGATSTDENPTHMYPAPGEYLATVTVTDSLGEDEQFQEFVTVTQVEPCVPPTKPQGQDFAPRPPHDGVDESVADSDADKDGIANAVDNCVFTANADQSDIDVDDSGDLCDTDMDNDGVVNAGDNCVDISNGSQLDQNGDGEGDLCDVDVDGDGVLNLKDNCATAPNADQADTDSNLRGDACDMLLFEAAAAPEASRPMTEEKGALATQELASTPWLAYLVAIIASMALVALLLVVVGRRK